MKNLSILISEHFFLDLASLGEARPSISSNISFFLTIIDLEVVLKEFLALTDLMKAWVFCIYKAMKVIIVNKNKDFVLATF